MNAVLALAAGVAIALAFFGGLHLTVRCAVGRPWGRAILAFGSAVRLCLAAAGFYAVTRGSPALAVPALAGFWAARQALIVGWGGARHGK